MIAVVRVDVLKQADLRLVEFNRRLFRDDDTLLSSN
jgi:hypothetical protein